MKMNSVVAVSLVALVCVSCSSNSDSGRTTVTLNGAGSTFVNPVMSKWTSEYSRGKDTRINYQSIGSGGGIRQVSEGTVDFGATDGPMTDAQIASSKAGPILHVPVVMGADVAAFNLQGVSGDLKLTPDLLADIFLGRIKQWNDPRLSHLNPTIKLPAKEIVVVHRSDGSGTTYIWTDYLSKVSPEWKTKVGTGASVSWPIGIGAKGNEGVAGMIRQTDGAIGYIELIYAEQNNIAFASIQNSSRNFVKASMESVTAAAASVEVPADFRYSITNSPGPNAYPVSGTTWLLIPVAPRDSSRGAKVVEFARWILNDGQEIAPTLHYARIPKELAARAMESLSQVK